ESIMTTTARIASLAALALSITLSGVAHADGGLTRAQVKAELAEAQRTGDIMDYTTGQKLNQLFPSAYPQAAMEIKPIASRASITAAKAVPASSGSIDFDAVVQRNAEALARGDAGLDDSQFAGGR